MTDTELLGLVQTEIEILQGGTEWGITILTGYLLIAYVIGRDLNFFQVSFVNIVFLVLAGSTIDSSVSSHAVVGNLMEELYQQNADFALRVGYGRTEMPIVAWLRPAVSMVVTLGALFFMWSVRHPKTK
ncbi:MAG: hypothetical protein ABJK25_12335 [Halieaceae bacterium]